MRRFASVLFLLAGLCALDPAVTPARAQAYAPGFPICLRVYGIITYTDCKLHHPTSMQRHSVGSGPNPYFASSGVVERSARHRRNVRDP